MQIRINCVYNDHGLYCKNKKIKRSISGLMGARLCSFGEYVSQHGKKLS